MKASISQVVVGVDFSPHSERAVREAARLHRDDHTGVAALHVVDRELVADLGSHPGFSPEEMRQQAEERLEKWLDEVVGGGHAVAGEVVVGHPFDALVHATERHHADLLVLGSRGLNAGVGHPGAVAAKCLRKAPVDVLLVRQHAEGPFRRVVACVDFSEGSTGIVQRAAAMADVGGGGLDVLHVHVPLSMNDMLLEPFPPADNAALVCARESLARRQMDDLLAGYAAAPGTPAPHGVLRLTGSATDGIVEYLREVNADLVVLGTRGRSGLKAFLLGTTAERLVHEAPCSVLTVKPAGG